MNEQLSALIDDEIAVEDAMHIVASLQSQKQAAEAWQQYHLIGDVMRGNAVLSADFKANLMKKLDAEPTVLAPNANKANSKTGYAAQVKTALPARWSMAASFAAVLVVGYMAMQSFTTADNAAPFEVAAVNSLDSNNVASQTSLVTPVNLASVSAVATSAATEVASQETNVEGIPPEYLMAHQASAPSASAYYMQTVSFSE